MRNAQAKAISEDLKDALMTGLTLATAALQADPTQTGKAVTETVKLIITELEVSARSSTVLMRPFLNLRRSYPL